MAGRLLLQRRRHLAAEVGRHRAAAGEDAAGDLLLQARHQAGDLGQPRRLPVQRGAELRHRAEQALRIGMLRACEERRDRRLLDLAAGIHDHHPLRDLGHHAEIVGDQHDGGADAVLQVAHQVEDLRLDGDVERRGRLVGDQQLRVAGQRHGDHHPLAHAARELVRIFAHPARRLRDADQRQHLDRLAPRPACAESPWCSRSVSPICRPTVSTGFSWSSAPGRSC